MRATVLRKPRDAHADAVAVKASAAQTARAAVLRDLDGVVHILTCGSVDDGKSTLMGRLLWDAADLPEDTRANLVAQAGPGGQPDVSLLVDGLVAEREQGITIDIAWRYFDAQQRRYVIIDSPGHEQYTRNMASGASHADVAIMLVDARHGVKRQTRRHAAILDLVGIRRVILAVNKMDLVDWSEDRFRAIEADFKAVTARFGFIEAQALPVAAKSGDNVARRSVEMDWYGGPTLLDVLARVPSRGRAAGGAFRMPVQTVVRGETDFRGLAGTVTSGRVAVGTVVVDSASGRRATVKRIVTMDGDLDAAVSGQAIVLQLDHDIDVSRGAVLAGEENLPTMAHSLDARLVWLSNVAFDADHGVLLRTATDLVPLASITMRSRLNLETMAESTGTICEPNDIVLADLVPARPVALDRFVDNRDTGSFVLVDALTGDTLAGGVVSGLVGQALAAEAGQFVLTDAVLARGVCAGVAVGSPEFRRRADEVALILKAAGVVARLDGGGR